jgi:hypothetical protein
MSHWKTICFEINSQTCKCSEQNTQKKDTTVAGPARSGGQAGSILTSWRVFVVGNICYVFRKGEYSFLEGINEKILSSCFAEE